MQFHPEHKDDHAHWDRVHAVSGDAKNRGHLEVEHTPKGGPNRGYDPAKQHEDGHHHMILGSFNNHADAHRAAQSLTGLKCDGKFPGHNCVDWTKKAVEKLHADGHIDAAHKDHFMAHYNAHAENVRAKTNTHENRAAARGNTKYYP